MTGTLDQSVSISVPTLPPAVRLLAHHCRRFPAGWYFAWQIPAAHSNVGVARGLVEDRIQDLLSSEGVFDLVTLVSELVTNAVKIADRTATVEMALHLHGLSRRLTLDVSDTNGSRGRWIPRRSHRPRIGLDSLCAYSETHCGGLGWGQRLVASLIRGLGGILRIHREGIWNQVHVAIPVPKLRQPYCPDCIDAPYRTLALAN